MEASIEFARLFKDQCVGEHNGSMAAMPNNPLFYSIFFAMTGKYKLSDLEFAEALEAVANALRAPIGDNNG